MIISFRHRFIFIAIPKTATHAFRNALRPCLVPNDWEQCNLFERKTFPVKPLAQISHGHLTYREVQPFLLPQIEKEFFKFCTVRNPYDRFVSASYFINRENEFMRADPLSAMKKIIQDRKTKQEILFRPQHEFVTDHKGCLAVDYVCKFETLQKDFDFVCRKIQLSSTPLQSVNVTGLPSQKNNYDEELRGMVEDFYQKDFDLFNYPTNLKTAPVM